MSDERLQILQMVAEGKVSAEEAIRLLDALKNGPRKRSGPQATHLRVQLEERGRRTEFTVGIGSARWLLSLLPLRLALGETQIDLDQVSRHLDEAAPGRLLEVTEGARRLEIWLDL